MLKIISKDNLLYLYIKLIIYYQTYLLFVYLDKWVLSSLSWNLQPT